ncbi:MAG: hypothetical protein JXB05_05445 [Myxococcaceae bacterium]|nr:hypothetical protein [Myxococcaceae bacterium]
MSSRLLLLGLLVLGSVGQVACSNTAEAAREEAVTEAAAKKPKKQAQAGGQFCGGIAAVQCPEGLTCVDDPNDTCDPTQSGFDCGGVCVSPVTSGTGGSGKPQCDYGDPTMDYISRDPEQCAAILFQCPAGSTPFFSDCGCGCQQSGSSCNYEDPSRRYVSQDPEQCATLRFFCEPGEEAFFDDCGCGCQATRAP